MTGGLKYVTVLEGGRLFGVSSNDQIWYNNDYKGDKKVWGNYVLMICKILKYFKNFFYRLNWLNS